MDPLIAKLLFLIGHVGATIVIRTPHIRAHHRNAIRSSRRSPVDNVLLFGASLGGFIVPLIYVFTPWLGFADYHPRAWIGITGIAVMLIADWIFWRSHHDLGGNWSPKLDIRQDHTLITNGLYRKIRHPMYLGFWLLVIAQAMILPNWLAGFAGLLTFAPLYVYRVPKEEQMMQEQFGGAYDDYVRSTGRLFPLLHSP